MAKIDPQVKLQIIKDFYALDSLIFGKHIKNLEVKESLTFDYVNTKGCLLSVLIEMMNLLEYSPKKKINIKSLNVKTLTEMARSAAVESRKKAILIISSSKGKDSIKKRILENASDMKGNLSGFVKENINKQALSIAMDRLLLLPIISESKNLKNHSTWEGRIVEDSYKILRDSLIDISSTIMND